MDCEDGMLAYIPTVKFDEKEFSMLVIEHFMGSQIRLTKDIIPDQDWNEDMEKYAAKMHKGSLLYMSGFFEDDVPAIKEKASLTGLTYQGYV